jgi:acyl carrier protein
MDILTQVITVIASQLRKKPEELKPENKLVEMNIDELDSIEIVMELENVFDINISDEDVEKFVTIEDIVNYLTTKTIKESGTEPIKESGK